MKIIADKSIPFIRSFFSTLGEIDLVDSSEIAPGRISGADVLLVRSFTRVNEELLAGSDIQFVGTATSGHDHIDTEYLNTSKIQFAHAPGCNARSVAEYVMSSLCVYSEARCISLHGKTAGIIGYGHVGSDVANMMGNLGIECLVYDPPLKESGSSIEFNTIEEICTADVISLHVPLVSKGEYPTYQILDKEFLDKLKPDVVLINTSRGPVIDEQALMNFINANPEASLILDVWDKEPEINLNILKKTLISTPHIAGYSLDGRLRGVQMICKQFCDYVDKEYQVPEAIDLPGRINNRLPVTEFDNDAEAIQMAILASYDVRTDSIGLRQLLTQDDVSTGDSFMELRNNYPIRREFSAMTIEIHDNSVHLKDKLSRLGFMLI